MYNVITSEKSKSITGGRLNNFIYKCYDKGGNVYWEQQPNSAGCLNTETGRMETNSKNAQRGSK